LVVLHAFAGPRWLLSSRIPPTRRGGYGRIFCGRSPLGFGVFTVMAVRLDQTQLLDRVLKPMVLAGVL